MNFNRKWRIHRPLVVASLHLRNLLDKGLVSLGISNSPNGWDVVFKQMVDSITDNEWKQSLLDNRDVIYRIPNLHLDTTNLFVNRATMNHNDIDYNVTNKLYEDTYFSLVSETYFFKRESPGRFLSEKTFKPIISKKPFIIF